MNKLEKIKSMSFDELDGSDFGYLILRIERLETEKEWLINTVICSNYNRYGHLLEKESEELLIDEMQQALKE